MTHKLRTAFRLTGILLIIFSVIQLIFFKPFSITIRYPTVETVGDTLCLLSPARYKYEEYGSGRHCASTSIKGVGFTYYNSSYITPSVQMLTSNDSMAVLIKIELAKQDILFTDDYVNIMSTTLHDIRYDTYYLPKCLR